MINITLSISLQTIFSGILTPRFFSLSQLGRQIIHGHHSLHQYSWRNILQSGDVIHFCIERWNHVDSPYKAVFFPFHIIHSQTLVERSTDRSKECLCKCPQKKSRSGLVTCWPRFNLLKESTGYSSSEMTFDQPMRGLLQTVKAMLVKRDKCDDF